RAYKYRKLELSDVNKMPSVAIEKGNNPDLFLVGKQEDAYRRMGKKLDSVLADTYTAAFLIIRNDSIIYEKYFDGFGEQSILPSFSVAKSFVGTLVGIASDEGKISVNASITDYIPELKKNDPRFEKITIRNLLDMRSGILFKEGNYNLKDDAIKMAFRPNTIKQLRKLKIEKPSGGEFNYQSINTYLLAIALQRVTDKKISAYLSEKIWKPAGMEHDATWTVDSKAHQQEIAYAGVNATARDFARLGKIYLEKGTVNNHHILSEQWINATVNKDTMQKYDGYKNQLWGVSRYKIFPDSLDAVNYKIQYNLQGRIGSFINKSKVKSFLISYPTPEFYAEGILGQFIYVQPEKNLIIVRLGHFWKNKKFPDTVGFLKSLATEL
ncbi:MAG: serine hydrolase domain-containing protein, partial [Ginsengibacter sp.]